jgi:hypothetical protein
MAGGVHVLSRIAGMGQYAGRCGPCRTSPTPLPYRASAAASRRPVRLPGEPGDRFALLNAWRAISTDPVVHREPYRGGGQPVFIATLIGFAVRPTAGRSTGDQTGAVAPSRVGGLRNPEAPRSRRKAARRSRCPSDCATPAAVRRRSRGGEASPRRGCAGRRDQ